MIKKNYKKYEDIYELSRAYLGIIVMTLWGIISYNKTGIWFS